MNQEMRLIIMIAAAFIVGLAVIMLVPGYNVSDNLASNAGYFPGVDASPQLSEPSEPATIPGIPVPGADDELVIIEKPPSMDFEF